MAMDDAIGAVLGQWLAEWHTTMDLAVGRNKSIAQKKKEEAKLKMAQLAENRNKEVVDKARQSARLHNRQGRKQVG